MEDFRIDRREISIIKISHILEYDALIIMIRVYYVILNSNSNNLSTINSNITFIIFHYTKLFKFQDQKLWNKIFQISCRLIKFSLLSLNFTITITDFECNFFRILGQLLKTKTKNLLKTYCILIIKSKEN